MGPAGHQAATQGPLRAILERDRALIPVLEAERAQGWPPPFDRRRWQVRQILWWLHRLSTGT